MDLFLKTHPNIPNFWCYTPNLNFYSKLPESSTQFPNPFNAFTWQYTKEGWNFWHDVSYNEWLPFLITYLLKKPNIEISNRNKFRKYFIEYFGELSLEV
jgi:hypothetical protein